MEQSRSDNLNSYDEMVRPVERKRKLSDISSFDTQRHADINRNSLENYIRNDKTLQILRKKGIHSLFPIQYETFTTIFQRNDLIARDRTGSGKTIAFALPILERFRINRRFITGSTKYLIVLPTRELALQVKNQICTLKHYPQQFHVVSVYGGTDINQQIGFLQKGADVIVSTPGRLIDLLEKNVIRLDDLEVICLDEADQMLRQGFQEQIEKIFGFVRKHTNKKIQNLLFSATIPPWVLELSKKYLDQNRQFIDLIKNSQIKTSKTIEHLSFKCNYQPTPNQISNIINKYAGNQGRVIIFTQTKKQANQIGARGYLRHQTQVLHGDISQKQRQFTFRAFKEGRLQCIVATNVAARGLDIPEVDLIVQIQPPKDVQTYIHRSGRTGRAGKSGICLTFYNDSQKNLIDKIEKVAQIKLEQISFCSEEKQIKNEKLNTQQNTKRSPINVYPPVYTTTQIRRQEWKDQTLNIPKEMKLPNSNNQNQFRNYTQQAKQLIQSGQNPVQLLAKMLAVVNRVPQQKKPRKSLLNGRQGYITYILRTPVKFYGLAYAYSFLKIILSQQYYNQIKELKRVGQKQVAFDFSQKHERDMVGLSDFIRYSPQFCAFSIEVAKEITQYNDCNIKMNETQEIATQQGIRQAFRRRKQLEMYIGNLPSEMTQKQLRQYLKSKRIVAASVKMVRNEVGDFRGVAFVICLNDGSVRNALNLNGQRLGSRPLKINIAANK